MEEGYISISGRILGAGWSQKKTYWGIGTIELDLHYPIPANRCPSCGDVVLPHVVKDKAEKRKVVCASSRKSQWGKKGELTS